MKINSLTSLRFFAALGVFLHHFHFFDKTINRGLQQAYTIFFEGFVGVTFFYILSGFIISYSYQLQADKRPYSSKEFLYNRFARLYPVHILTLLIALLVYFGLSNFPAINVEQLLANILLIQSAIPDQAFFFSFNGVAWSISVELFFYLAFAFCFVKLTTRTLVFIGVVFFVVISYLIQGPLAEHPLRGWIFYINPAFRVIDFVVGILLYRIYASGKFNINNRWASALEFLALLGLAVFAYIGISQVDIVWRYDIFYIFPMAIVVYVFAHGLGVLSKLISNGLIVLLGEASFSLYMIHQIIIAIALRNSVVDINQVNQVGWFIGTTILVGIVVSVIMYVYYERPVNEWLRNKWKNRYIKSVAVI